MNDHREPANFWIAVKKEERGSKRERRQKSGKKEKEEGRKGKQEEQGHPLHNLTPDRPPRAAAYY